MSEPALMAGRLSYCPTVLLVDDDVACTDVWREKFQDETSIGVVVANSLEEGRRLVDEPSIHIDGIVADYFFEAGKTDPDNDLNDGLDLLSLFRMRRPDSLRFMLSFYADRDVVKHGLSDRGLQLCGLFPKLYYWPADSAPPWRQVEKELLTSYLERVDLPGAAHPPGDAGQMAERVQGLQIPVRTYLQSVSDRCITVLKPIEVIYIREGEDHVRATAPLLGLLAEGHGAGVGDAIEDLSAAISEQFRIIMEADAEAYVDYAARVRARLLEHLRLRDDVEAKGC